MSRKKGLEGRTGIINIQGLDVRCTIQQTRRVYGRTDCLVTPVSGKGEIWVRESSLRLSTGGTRA